jgi:hypothetical protein
MTSLDGASTPARKSAPASTVLAIHNLLVLLAVFAVAIPWQMRWGTVPDTSWLISMCERLYAGVEETNPSLAVWLYMPPYVLSVWLGVAPEFTVHFYSYALCAFGLAFAAFIARRADFAENAGLFALLPVFLALLILFPGNAFTQRDHIGAALLAPLLVMTAWRIVAGKQEQPTWQVAVPAGLAGGIIVLVKPFYVLAIIAPALYLAWRKRSLRPLFGVEYWSAAAVLAVYLGALLWVFPGFISDMLPRLSESYLSMKLPLWTLLQKYAAGYLLVFIVLKRVRPGLPLSPLAAVLSIASVAAMAVMLYQGKGWPYHAYPAIAFGLAALFCQAVRSPTVSWREFGWPRALLVACAVVVNALPFMVTQKPDSTLVGAIQQARERPDAALIGSDIAAGHPLTRMAGGRWVSAYASDFVGNYALYLARTARNDRDAHRYQAIAADYAAFKLAELNRIAPDILLVQKDDSLWQDYFVSREGYAAFMASYRKLAEDDTVTAYVRREPARPAGSPASGSD